MQIQLELPQLPVRLVLESSLSDDEFECLSITNDFMQLERTKEGEIILNAPAGGLAGTASSEITYQLRNWWRTHKRGKALGSNCGFFLSDSSSLSPYAAYITAEQLAGITHRQMERFLRLCPAFVIELVSKSDRRKAAEAKMLDWIANGALLGWLIDPYKKSVTIYEPNRKPRTTKDKIVSGTGPVNGFEFNAAEVWSCYEL